VTKPHNDEPERRSPDETASITDEAVEHARELVGVWLRRDVHWPAFAEPISAIDIRRWALYSMGDDNPLWTSEDYARSSVWGTLVAPATFLWTVDSGIVAPRLRGVQWIYGGTRWELFRPVRVNDQFTARARLIDLQEKSGGRVPKLVVQTGEIIYTNQRDEVVARAENDILRVPRARSGEGIGSASGGNDAEPEPASKPHKYSSEEIDRIRDMYLAERRRGSEPLYWDDVKEGDEIPPLVRGPLTMVDLVAAYAGRRQVYNPLRLAVLERERHPDNVYTSRRTGIPMHPAAGHLDPEIAREIGMPGVYDLGWMRANWMLSAITNWAGDWSFVRRFDYKLRVPNMLGDTTWLTGRVTRTFVEDTEHLVEIATVGENQRGEQNGDGLFVVRLPSREPSDWFVVPA
jgi:acyl dehydratase